MPEMKSTGIGVKSFLGSDSTRIPVSLSNAAPSRNKPETYTPSAGGARTSSARSKAVDSVR